MKNCLAMAFLVIAFAVGAVIFAGLYFGAVFGALSWLDGMELDDRAANLLGGRVGAVAGPVGIVVGVLLALDLGWTWFTRADGGADWAARAVGLVLGAPLAVLWLINYALPALDVVARYKVPGLFSVIGFVGMAGWVRTALAKRA